MGSGSRTRFALTTVAAGVALALGLQWFEREGARAASPQPLQSAAEPIDASVPQVPRTDPRYTGVAISDRRVELRAPVAGWVRWRGGEVGDAVDEGTVVAEIASDRVTADVRKARAELGAADAEVERTRAELQAARRMLRSAEQLGEVMAGDELRAARTEADVAKSRHDAARATLEASRARLAEVSAEHALHTIKAPFAAHVSLQYLQDGAWAAAGTPLARLIASGRPVVRFAVPPDVGARLRVDDEATIELDDGADTATVISIAPHVDEPTGLVFVEAAVGGDTVRPQHGQVVAVALAEAI